MKDAAPAPAVRYRIDAIDPRAHLFEVLCQIARPAPDGQRFFMPTWIPGSYLQREFARHVVTIEARCRGRAVTLQKLDKSTWRAAPCRGELRLRYRVYAFDTSCRGAYLDLRRGFFNGSSVFVAVEEQTELPVELDIAAPRDPALAKWRIGTALPVQRTGAAGFGLYRAADYDALIDYPVELGEFNEIPFTARRTPHRLIISGRHRVDAGQLARDLTRLCTTHIDLFGAPAPFPRYLFLCNTLPQGYSGLEHRDSTALSAPRDCFPSASRNGRSEAYRTFLGLASHEYFHAWNVKRIKPAAFTPYDLRQENYTGLLWLFEGFTSYYDDLLLLRAGLIDEAQYLELLGRTITTVWRTPGRHKQSLRDASFDAWIKYYRQDENSPNAIVSYYAKGALVALALDLTLRHQTRGRRSLDDVMRALWQRYGATGTGLAEDGLGPLLRDVTGVDCDEFFANFVDTPADPPLAELLGRAGVELRWRGAESSSDRGGRAGTSTRADLGLKLADGDTRVSHVYAGGAAEQAGLAAGDLLVAVDGLRVTGNNFDKLCGQLGAGDVIDIHLFRREELMQLQLTVQAPPETTCTLSLAASAKPAQRRRRAQWLHGGGGKEDRQ